jgi:hypothetical protein
MVSRRRLNRSAGPVAAANIPAMPQSLKAGLNMGLLGDLGLNAFRDAALRAGRLAETLFDAPEADVIAVNDGIVWRAKSATVTASDEAARLIALGSDRPVWVADMDLDPRWRDHPARGAAGVRFCAAAPSRSR